MDGHKFSEVLDCCLRGGISDTENLREPPESGSLSVAGAEALADPPEARRPLPGYRKV